MSEGVPVSCIVARWLGGRPGCPGFVRWVPWATGAGVLVGVIDTGLDLTHPERPGFGVARFVRLRDTPEVAEFSLTVLDTAQGHGLGSLLQGLRRVVQRCAAEPAGHGAGVVDRGV